MRNLYGKDDAVVKMEGGGADNMVRRWMGGGGVDAAAKAGSWKAEMETCTGAEEKPSHAC